MYVYVAARFAEKERVRGVHHLLRSRGHDVSLDWTEHPNARPYARYAAVAATNASADLDGVDRCDAFVLLTTAEIGGGSSAEFGAALMSYVRSGRPSVYVVGPHMDTNVFFFHPAVRRRMTFAEVLAELDATTELPATG